MMRLLCLFLLACGTQAEVDPVTPLPKGPSGTKTPAANDPEPPAPRTLRIVASNLTSGTEQSYDEGAGKRILQALKPDIALMQEFNHTDVDAFVESTFAPSFSYIREAYSLPNGIISRYKFIESGSWDDPQVNNRGFAYAHIDLPGDDDLWAFSVHLLTANPEQRQLEAAALMAQIEAVAPPNAWLVLGGDFNTQDRDEPCLTTFGARFVVTGPHPADKAGDSDTNASRLRPYDWVLSSTPWSEHETGAFVFDTRVETLPPALETDSAAPNMQHMAVVKDYSF